MRIILRKKRILLSGLFLAVLLLSSLFFARHFSALNTKGDIQKQNTRLSQEDSTQNIPQKIKNETVPSSVFSAENEKEKISDVVRQPLRKKEIPQAVAKNISIPELKEKNTGEVSISDTPKEPQILPQESQPIIQKLSAIRIVDGDTLVLSDKKTVRL